MTGKFYKIVSAVLVLKVRLTPSARIEQISGVFQSSEGNCYLKISVRAVPENGNANGALIKLLSKFLGIAKNEIKLINGQTSRLKTLSIPHSVEIVERLEEIHKSGT